jgi:hypothetical protein
MHSGNWYNMGVRENVMERKQLMVAAEPVVNVRRLPVDARGDYLKDDLQETQLLYNEEVLVKEEEGDWYRVEAVEQQGYRQARQWQGYPGWVRKGSLRKCEGTMDRETVVVRSPLGHLLDSPDRGSKVRMTISLGTKLDLERDTGLNGEYFHVRLVNGGKGWIRKDEAWAPPEYGDGWTRRVNVVITALLFAGTPYLWGGRSTYMPELASGDSLVPVATGVDCSGFTNLVYRANGWDIPRDGHEQWMVSEKVTFEGMREGDLIFLSAEGDRTLITHVMLFLGGESFIEAPETGENVARKSFAEKFGRPAGELAAKGFVTGERQLYFGRILP